MKISIWQQFSSNHSAHFTLVGLFETVAAAQQASENIQEVLTLIGAWHEANPQESEHIFMDYVEEEGLISPVEQALATRFYMKWDIPILWFDNYKLVVHDRFLFIEDVRQAEAGAHPIFELINRLGGQAFIRGDLHGWAEDNLLRFKVYCTAPDNETAAKIVAEFGGRHGDRNVWDIFLGGEDDSLELTELPSVLDKLKGYHCTSIQCFTIQEHRHYLNMNDEA